MMVTFIDPPSGWKYGFPKAIPDEKLAGIKNLKEWFLEQGYPQAEMDSCGEHFFYRVWREEVPGDEK